MNLKPSDLSDARAAGARKPGDNRFERWLRRREGNGLLLLLGFVFLLFAFDSILAFALVLSGVREADLFYATAWMSTRAADHANLRGLREVLPRHPRLYSAYSDRFEADGLLGGRLVRNFLTIAPSKKLDWAEKSFWFMTNDQGFPPAADDMPHYAIPKPAGVFRVIVIGGSTVEGNGVNSPLDSLPAKLQGLFDSALRSIRTPRSSGLKSSTRACRTTRPTRNIYIFSSICCGFSPIWSSPMMAGTTPRCFRPGSPATGGRDPIEAGRSRTMKNGSTPASRDRGAPDRRGDHVATCAWLPRRVRHIQALACRLESDRSPGSRRIPL